MNGELFGQGMASMQKLFGYTVSPDTLRFYWSACAPLTDEQFRQIIERLTSTFVPSAQTPFPVPAHFVRASGNTPENKAQEAVAKVKHAVAVLGRYQSVTFNDGALHAVIDRFGGWIAICEWSDKDWQINSKSFIQGYISAINTNQKGPAHLTGLQEAENRDRFPEHVPVPKLVEKAVSGRLVAKEADTLRVESQKPDKEVRLPYKDD